MEGSYHDCNYIENFYNGIDTVGLEEGETADDVATPTYPRQLLVTLR